MQPFFPEPRNMLHPLVVSGILQYLHPNFYLYPEAIQFYFKNILGCTYLKLYAKSYDILHILHVYVHMHMYPKVKINGTDTKKVG